MKTQLEATVLLADVEEDSPNDSPQKINTDSVPKVIVKESDNAKAILSSKEKPRDDMRGPDGIYQALHRYSNFHTILNIVAQCFRALALMARGIKDEERREEIVKGFAITRIPAEISQDKQKKIVGKCT